MIDAVLLPAEQWSLGGNVIRPDALGASMSSTDRKPDLIKSLIGELRNSVPAAALPSGVVFNFASGSQVTLVLGGGSATTTVVQLKP